MTAKTITKVTGTAHLEVIGDLALAAVNHATLTATGDASDANSGAGIAVANLDQTTTAFIDSTSAAPTTAAKLDITADSQGANTSTTKAGVEGSTQNDKDPNSADRGNGQANTADGNIGIAGALSVNVLHSSTGAYISGSRVNTTGVQRIHAGSSNGATAAADGSTTSGSGLGVGVAVGINVVTLLTEAYLAGGAILNAGGVVLEAFGPGSGKNTFSADSTSGAGGDASVGVAGSLALNIITATTLANVRGAGANLNGSDLTQTAKANHENKAKAKAKQNGGGSVGIGASVAINIINNVVEAGLAVNAILTAAKKLAMNATTTDAATTEASGGAAGGSAAVLTGVVGITISNVSTSASVRRGAALTTTGNITGKADQTATVETKALGATTAGAGATLGAAISFALTSAEHLVDSSLYRNTTSGGLITMEADGTSTTATTATASAAGAEGGQSAGGKDSSNKDSKQKSDAQLGFADSKSTSTNSNGTSTPAAKNEDGTTVTVAAAIALNLVTSTTTALAAAAAGQPAIVVIAAGAVTFKALNNTDAKAIADGSASNGSSVTIGAGLAINKVILRNEASIGVGTAVTAGGLNLTAGMRPLAGGTDAVHAFEADAKAGASGSSGNLGIAGAFALNIIDQDTLATVHADPTPAPQARPPRAWRSWAAEPSPWGPAPPPPPTPRPRQASPAAARWASARPSH